MSDRESQSINDFGKWEQAFRVYANVYTKMFHEKASELIQYNHVIYTASLSYLWDNVYTYDKEFRMHISQFPQRSWAVILQQAWTLYMKDRLRYAGGGNVQNTEHNGNSTKKEICRRFNKGKCKNGSSCRYDHRCEGCGKWGHGLHICRNRQLKDGAPNAGNASTNVASPPKN